MNHYLQRRLALVSLLLLLSETEPNVSLSRKDRAACFVAIQGLKVLQLPKPITND